MAQTDTGFFQVYIAYRLTQIEVVALPHSIQSSQYSHAIGAQTVYCPSIGKHSEVKNTTDQ